MGLKKFILFFTLILLLYPLVTSAQKSDSSKTKNSIQKIFELLEISLKLQMKIMPKNTFEQRYAAQELLTHIYNEHHNPSKIPLSFALIGSPNVGKVGLIHGLAKSYFNNTPQLIPLGIHEGFEKALKATPNGGIIVFTGIPLEADHNTRLFLKELFDFENKKIWKSRSSGISYDLSRHVLFS